MDLPVFAHQNGEKYKESGVDTGNYPLTIEGIMEKEVTDVWDVSGLNGEKRKVISRCRGLCICKTKG